MTLTRHYISMSALTPEELIITASRSGHFTTISGKQYIIKALKFLLQSGNKKRCKLHHKESVITAAVKTPLKFLLLWLFEETYEYNRFLFVYKQVFIVYSSSLAVLS